MQSKVTTVEEYLASLPEERREIISSLRDRVRKSIPKGYEEVMNWGMITYQIPLSYYPNTYNKQPLSYVALASQKNNNSLYLTVRPDEEEKFRKEWAATGKKLDMGKSCIRFKKIDELALDILDRSIASTSPDAYIAYYESSRGISS